MAPDTYTESSLGAYLITSLGEVAGALGWESLTDVQEAVNDALLWYGVGSIAAATDVLKLRSLARVAGWRMACASLSARFTFATDQQSFNRSDMLKGALQILRREELDAAKSGYAVGVARVAPNIEIGRLRYTGDPYNAQIETADRVLAE